MYLRAKDIEPYNEFVRSLYVPQTEDSLRRTIVDGLIKLIPGENAAASSFDFRTRSIVSKVSSHRFFSAHFYDGIEAFIADHPLGHTLLAPPIPGGSVLSDYVTRGQWQRTGTYNEVFREEGFNDQLSIEISRQSPHLLPTGIAVFRSKRGFALKERRLMTLVHPHIKQAFDNMSQGNLPAIFEALEGRGLSDPGEGMILLDVRKRIIHCSGTTRQMLADFFPASLPGSDYLPAEIDSFLRPSGPRLFTKTVKNETLDIRIYQDVVGRYLLTIRATGPACASARLMQLGLSRREAEVLYWIAQGKRNEEVAIILGMSFFTVKNHLKRIFSALDVETRTAAVASARPYL